jgi:hypothetical protein
LDIKAYNLFYCGRYARDYQCPKGHLWNTARTCKQRFCKECAQRIADLIREAYKHVVALIESAKEGETLTQAGQSRITSGKFQFLSLRTTCKRSTRDIEALGSKIRRGLMALIPKDHRYVTKVWFNIVGFDSTPSDYEKLTVRVLWWGEMLSPEAFRAVLPGVETCLIRDVGNFRGYFDRLIDSVVPSDCRERGRQEVIFDGIKKLRSIGTINVSDLFPSNTPLGNNVASPPETEGGTVEDTDTPDSKCPICRPKCPLCHERASRYTDYRPRGTPSVWHDF